MKQTLLFPRISSSNSLPLNTLFYTESSRKILFLQSGKLKTHVGQNPVAIPVLPA
jgi:hypothetical protein